MPAPKAPQAVPNYFKAPFGEWTAEDSAQHAYNLAQWRVRILQVFSNSVPLQSGASEPCRLEIGDQPVFFLVCVDAIRTKQ